MAMFDRLKFWKRKEVDLEKELGIGLTETGLPGREFDETGLPKPSAPIFEPTPAMTPSAFKEQASYQQQGTGSKDIELISAKLDTIKVMLESINNRLAVLEREYHREEQKKQVGWYA